VILSSFSLGLRLKSNSIQFKLKNLNLYINISRDLVAVGNKSWLLLMILYLSRLYLALIYLTIYLN